jgi:dihydrofolate reductase
MNLIVACDKDGGIGKANLVDTANFRRLTCETRRPDKKNAVIMGRKTWESLSQRPLPDRMNVVISSTLLLEEATDVLCVWTLEEALKALSAMDNIEDVYVIGGATLSNAVIDHPSLSTVYLTVIDAGLDCDVFFPICDIVDDFQQICNVDASENGVKMSLQIFIRVNP